jgi:glycosyltransferase involved in cell wall biosynthesis
MASTVEPSGAAGAERSRGLSLLVVIPALDEEKTVGSVIRGIPRDLPGVAQVEVLVVDDGSRDRTSAEAEAAGARVVRHESPRGVGAAFGTALRHAIDDGADLIVSIDADGQFDPRDIPALIEPVCSGRVDFASASRFKDPALIPRMPFMKRWGNGVMAGLVSRLTGQTFHDVSHLHPGGLPQSRVQAAAHRRGPGGRAWRTGVWSESRGRQPLALCPQHHWNHLPLLPRLPADALFRIHGLRRTSGRASPGRRRSCSRCRCSSSA